MGRRHKNQIDTAASKKFLEDVYGLRVQQINYYQFRVWHEEHDGFFDWYHTTGSTVVATRRNGETYQRRLGTYLDDESLANAINDHLHKAETYA